MDIKELVKELDGCQVKKDLVNKEEAEKSGLVICYGYSFDQLIITGAINDECQAFDGKTVCLDVSGPVTGEETGVYVETSWCKEEVEYDGNEVIIPWYIKTNIYHERFLLLDNGEPFCSGVIFRIKDLMKRTAPPEGTIYFARLRQEARIPKKDPENAGYDIWACFEEDIFTIPAHTTRLVPTCVACALNPKWYFQVEERGSTGSSGIKKSAGVIDSGYRGEIFIAISNVNNKDIAISKIPVEKTEECLQRPIVYYPYSKAIAQLVLHEVPKVTVKEIPYKTLKGIPSTRKDGKLGSSGA